MDSLLQSDEPAPFEVLAGDPSSPFLLIADHAGCKIPRSLGDLGVSDADRKTHIAWDIGIREVSFKIARALDAFLAVQTYSRLVIDCNRPLESPGSIVQRTAGVDVPGNCNLMDVDRQRRVNEVFRPYHERVEAEVSRRLKHGQATLFVAMHSFTPVFMGTERPWHIGLLFNRDARVARVLKRLLSEDSSLIIGENQPYAVSDTSDYSVVNYGECRNIPHIEIEIRQDLIEQARGQDEWALRLVRVLRICAAELNLTA